jgi:hypothetical protein
VATGRYVECFLLRCIDVGDGDVDGGRFAEFDVVCGGHGSQLTVLRCDAVVKSQALYSIYGAGVMPPGGQHILCIAFCVALRTWVGPFELGCARGSGGGFAVAVESQEKVCHRGVTIIHDLFNRSKSVWMVFLYYLSLFKPSSKNCTTYYTT